jgi:hypothetical protein
VVVVLCSQALGVTAALSRHAGRLPQLMPRPIWPVKSTGVSSHPDDGPGAMTAADQVSAPDL